MYLQASIKKNMEVSQVQNTLFECLSVWNYLEVFGKFLWGSNSIPAEVQ